MKHSIKFKLFFIFIIILILNILFTFFMGTALFERLYTKSRTDELKKGAEQIRAAYRGGQDYQSILTEVENKNTTIGIISVTESELEIIYYSRPYKRQSGSSRYNLNGAVSEIPMQFRRLLLNPSIFTSVKDTNNFYIEKHSPDNMKISQRNFKNSPAGDTAGQENYPANPGFPGGMNGFYITGGNSIFVLGHIKDDLYIIGDTPTQYIKNTSNLAIKYILYISIFTFILGAAVIYFTVDKISKPIRKIQNITDKISSFDFSDRCEITSNDEIGRLAENINNMSDKLQENISRIIEANHVLQEDLKRQEETDKMRKQFIANVSHDFKTPLTLIVSYAEALRDLPETSESIKSEYCNIVIDEGNKMNELVQMLLKLSQLESGMLKIEKTIFSIDEIVSDIMKNHRLPMDKKQIKAEKYMDDDYIVLADYQKIELLITNLLENAIKYSPAGSNIRVWVQKSGGKCRVSVYNSGSHIEESELENIFISFYRMDKSRNRDMQSYGLGLAIVKAIMDMHGQNYGAVNKDGGVEFWFELESVELEDTTDE